MGSEAFQKLVKNPPKDQPYDLILTEAFGANCYFGLAYVFNVPVVAVSSSIEFPWISHFIGSHDNLAVVPNAFQDAAGPMNFWQRLNNVLNNHMSILEFHSVTEKSQTESMRKYLKPDIPNIREVEKNVALLLVNGHPTIFSAKPVAPATVHVTGLHLEENEERLTPELKKWMDNSTDGVVYFTFGSMVLIESLPREQLLEMYASFKRIAPVRVLIKVADQSKLPPGVPHNVKALPWIPQQPVLAHPNTKVFITHGGLLGLLEALHYGVPMIGIPLFSDQFRNVKTFVAKEVMLRINLEDLSKETLDSALDTLLHDPQFKEKVVYYSRLTRDQALSPMKTAIFWIEYVARNGGQVFRSPALEMTWWQLALLDVYSVILSCLTLLLISIVYGTSFVLKKLFQRSNKKTGCDKDEIVLESKKIL